MTGWARASVRLRATFEFGTPWGYRFHCQHRGVDRGTQPTLFRRPGCRCWEEFADHPESTTSTGRSQNCAACNTSHRDPVTVPVLNVAGWFDAEDFYGPDLEVYQTYRGREPTSRASATLVVGPWLPRRLGRHRTRAPTSVTSSSAAKTSRLVQGEQIQCSPFFEHHLKDAGQAGVRQRSDRVRNRRQSSGTSFDDWPPRSGVEVPTRCICARKGGLVLRVRPRR